MNILKRILICIIWVACLPFTLLAYLFTPVFGILAVIRYIITGKDGEDLIYIPMEWGVNLPYIFIDKIDGGNYDKTM